MSDADACAKNNFVRKNTAYRREDRNAVRDVGVVARKFDDFGANSVLNFFDVRDGNCQRRQVKRGNFDFADNFARRHENQSRFDASRRTSTRRISAAQKFFVHVNHARRNFYNSDRSATNKR